MASPHAPARRLAAPRLLIGLVAAGGLTLTAAPAAATPERPGSSQEAAALVAERAHRLEVVTEEFNEAREQLRASQDAASRAAEDVAAAEAILATARERVRSVARGAWTSDRLSTLSAMLTSDSPEEMLDRVGTLQTIASHNNVVLGGAEQASDAADRARSAAEQAAADAQALVDQVSAQQAALDAQVAEFQAQYDRLLADEQRAAREAAERHAAEEAAEQTAERAAAEQAAHQRAPEQQDAPERVGTSEQAPRSTGGTSRSAPAPAPRPAAAAPAQPAAPAPVAGGSGAAQKAVDTAMAQLGDPYVWAAAGPNAFDCSGLVQYAYAAAGVNVPHSSRMQSTMGTPVSRADLQPGDLVFFYSPVSHVGIYIGNGQMVHASTYGQPVKVAPVDGMGGYNSARRIIR